MGCAAHFVLGDQAVWSTARPIVQANCRIVFLMVHHHHAFGPRKGISHCRKPTAQRCKFLLGEFVLGRQRVSPRRNAPHRQWKRHNIGLLGHFVPFAPDFLTALVVGRSPRIPTSYAPSAPSLRSRRRHGKREKPSSWQLLINRRSIQCVDQFRFGKYYRTTFPSQSSPLASRGFSPNCD